MCQSAWVSNAYVAIVGEIVGIEQDQIHIGGLLVAEQAWYAWLNYQGGLHRRVVQAQYQSWE
jgi:hypothetical protein